MSKRYNNDDRLFHTINYMLTGIALFLTLYPLFLVVISSFSSPEYVLNGKVWLYPKGFTLDGYIKIFEDTRIWVGYMNTILYAFVGTGISLFATLPAAYALSRKDLVFRNFFMFFFTFTMFFSGGLIPTFLLVRDLGMYDTFWVMVIPSAVGIWNLILARTFIMNEIPDELYESAAIDGCSNIRFFVSIVLPLSKAIIAVISLYCIVGHWNNYFNALIYLKSSAKYPLQLFLRDILIVNNNVEELGADEALSNIVEVIKYGVIIVSIIPLVLIYPFLQKYFVKGVMVGSLKG